MKKARIISAVAAITTATVSVSVLSSNASTFYVDDSYTDFYDSLNERGYMLLEPSQLRNGIVETGPFGEKPDVCYFAHTKKFDKYNLVGLIYQPDTIFIKPPEDLTSEEEDKLAEDVKQFVQEFNEINGSTDFRVENPQIAYVPIDKWRMETFEVVSASGNDITSADARDLCNFLKEKGFAEDCYYTNTLTEVFESDVYADSMIYYSEVKNTLQEKRTAIQNYLNENNYDWTIRDVPYARAIEVVPNYEATLEEQIEMASKLYDDLGYSISFSTLCSSKQVSDKADVLNSIEGDANNDGTVSLADVVTIMQSVGNPDEYSLDPQQKFNADVSGNGDGITNMDARIIQRRLLGLE